MLTHRGALLITGPTASGKTVLAHHIYDENTCLVNADSRQVYKDFDIGTAKPPSSDIKRYGYHHIDFLDPRQRYNVDLFLEEARRLAGQNPFKNIVFIGGTPLYMNALEHGLIEHNPVPLELKKKVSVMTHNQMFEFLKRRDPEYLMSADCNNKRRLERAVEITLHTGSSYSSLRKKRKPSGFRLFKVIVCCDRSSLYKRIERRTNLMFENGLEKEVRSLFKTYGFHIPAFTGIGYREWNNDLHGSSDIRDVRERIKKNTRRYAKQQQTWFKKATSAIFFHKAEPEGIRDPRNEWIYSTPLIEGDSADPCKIVTRIESGEKIRLLYNKSNLNFLKKVADVFFKKNHFDRRVYES